MEDVSWASQKGNGTDMSTEREHLNSFLTACLMNRDLSLIAVHERKGGNGNKMPVIASAFPSITAEQNIKTYACGDPLRELFPDSAAALLSSWGVLASFNFLFSALSTCDSAGSHSTLSFHFRPQQAAALVEESLKTYSTQEPVSDWLMNTEHRLVHPRSISQTLLKTIAAKNERIFKIFSDTRLFSWIISVFLSPQLYIMLDCSHILSHLVLSLHH